MAAILLALAAILLSLSIILSTEAFKKISSLQYRLQFVWPAYCLLYYRKLTTDYCT